MKIIGLNTEDYDASLLEEMFTGETEDAAPIVRESTKQQVSALSKRYIKFAKQTRNIATSPAFEMGTNGRACFVEGVGLHNIKVKGCSDEEILERLQSIAEYGLLACEWFGLRYDENEVPFRVSFFRVGKTMPVYKFAFSPMWVKSGSQKPNPLTNSNGISIVVDISNPALRHMIEPYDILDEQSGDSWLVRAIETENSRQCYAEKNATDAYKSFINSVSYIRKMKTKNGKLDWVNENTIISTIERVIKHYSYHGLNEYLVDGKIVRSVSVEEILQKLVPPTPIDTQKIANRIYKERESRYLSDAELQHNYEYTKFAYVYAGVPSQFITGFVLPISLVYNKDLIEGIEKIFPGIPIVGVNGVVLNSGTTIKF